MTESLRLLGEDGCGLDSGLRELGAGSEEGVAASSLTSGGLDGTPSTMPVDIDQLEVLLYSQIDANETMQRS